MRQATSCPDACRGTCLARWHLLCWQAPEPSLQMQGRTKCQAVTKLQQVFIKEKAMQASAFSAALQNALQLHSMKRAAQGCSACCSRQVCNVFNLAVGMPSTTDIHHSASSSLDWWGCQQELASQPAEQAPVDAPTWQQPGRLIQMRPACC